MTSTACGYPPARFVATPASLSKRLRQPKRVTALATLDRAVAHLVRRLEGLSPSTVTARLLRRAALAAAQRLGLGVTSLLSAVRTLEQGHPARARTLAAKATRTIAADGGPRLVQVKVASGMWAE